MLGIDLRPLSLCQFNICEAVNFAVPNWIWFPHAFVSHSPQRHDRAETNHNPGSGTFVVLHMRTVDARPV